MLRENELGVSISFFYFFRPIMYDLGGNLFPLWYVTLCKESLGGVRWLGVLVGGNGGGERFYM